MANTDNTTVIASKAMREVVDYFDEHDLTVTPAGKWEMVDGKKQALDAKRVDGLSWDKYPNDNMGRLFLREDVLVLDVDGAEVVFHDNNTVTIIDLDMTIPYGLYTTTTKKNKFHFYYYAETLDIPNRIVGLYDHTIDVFSYGTVFEGHTFSQDHNIHKDNIPEAPEALLLCIDEWVVEKGLEVSSTNDGLGITSHINRFNVVKAFLANELKTAKQNNAFYKVVMPSEYMPKRKSGLSIETFKLSYDLFNKVAVKLTTTAELDFNEHTLPALQKLLRMWGINPDSKKSKGFLWGNILPSLPQHESIHRYTAEEDTLTFTEHLAHQPNTMTPIFRVIHGSKTMFMEVDKYSQLPVDHGDSYYIDMNTAKGLHPERNIVNEEGRIVGWDEYLPYVYTVNNPYAPQYVLDDKYDRHTINLYSPTDYVQQAEVHTKISDSNLVYKAIRSTIGEMCIECGKNKCGCDSFSYLDLYLAYSAQILFGNSSPTMVMWMSALKTEKGGAGKSVVTLELFSLMLGTAATAIDSKTVNSGWGDIVTSTKILSLEDMPQLGLKDWELVYSNIKQQNTNSYRKLNMKGGAIKSQRVSIAITGSTNHRISLSPSDRRFLCLEPAHLHGLTEPLDNGERLDLAELLSSNDYDKRLQDYVNYLYYIFDRGFTDKMRQALFISAPPTIYRPKWVSGGETNSQNIIHCLSDARALIDICKVSPDDLSNHITHLFEMVVLAWNEENKMSAVSWKWFEEALPYVQSDRNKDNQYSKTSICKMLHIDFENVGKLYTDKWRGGLPDHMDPEWQFWPAQGYRFRVTEDEIATYKQVIEEMK